MVRFAIFVDGSNLFGSIKRLGLDIQDYEKFYLFILAQAINYWNESVVNGPEKGRLIRVLWYEVGSIDEWDLNDPISIDTLRTWFSADQSLKNAYIAMATKSLGSKGGYSDPTSILQDAWELCFKEAKEWYQQKADNIAKAHGFHFGVTSSADFLDIIACGHLKVDILHRTALEKGLDTSLAVDMVALADIYDVALVVSGDADSIPSVEYVKRKGKQVGVIEFIKGHPPEKKARESSSKLKAKADFVLRIYETDLQRAGIANVWVKGR